MDVTWKVPSPTQLYGNPDRLTESCVKLGLNEKEVIKEVQRLLEVKLLEGSLISYVLAKIREEQLIGVLKEASDMFDGIRERMTSHGSLSKEDAKLSQELLVRLKVLLELSRELKISMFEELTRQKINELKKLVSQYDLEN